jgi:hypothetical protein
MSLEHSPARQGKRAAYSLNEFCEAVRSALLSRSQRRLGNHSPREGRAG